jgi:hypothetical protein
MIELLARLADRRRIDERHIGRGVRHHNGIEQRLVACLQVGQEKVFLKIAIQRLHLRVHARDLQIQRIHRRR